MEFENEFEIIEALRMLDNDDSENIDRLHENVSAAMKKTHNEISMMMDESKHLGDAVFDLSQERKEHISTIFGPRSFKVDIECFAGGSVHLKFASLQGKPLSFAPHEVKLSDLNYDENRTLLAAIIILEVSFMLPFDIIGVTSHISDEAKSKAIEKIKVIFSYNDDVITKINGMAESNKNNNGVAEAIVQCLRYPFDSRSTASFDVAKALLSDLPWYKIPIVLAKLAHFLVYLRNHTNAVIQRINELLNGSEFLSKLSQWDKFNSLPLTK